MIYELAPALFSTARRLFARPAFDEAIVAAVFEGRQPGRLIVDDASHPTAALLCRTYEFYLAGDAGTAPLRRFIAEAPVEADAFDSFYGYVPFSADWVPVLLSDHAGRLVVIERRALRLRGSHLAAPSAPSGVAVRPLAGDLAARTDRALQQAIGATWSGYEQFDAQGFGVCALIGGTVVSAAYAIAVGAGQASIDIETAEAYRGRGFATLVGAAFIDACRARGLTPSWEADAANTASLALAAKLGFAPGVSYSQLSPTSGRPLDRSHRLWTLEEGTMDGPFTRAWRRHGEA